MIRYYRDFETYARRDVEFSQSYFGRTVTHYKPEEFAPCPPRTIQMRAITPTGNHEGPGHNVLWRTEHCHGTRWHYAENPCTCRGHLGRVWYEQFKGARYTAVLAPPMRGTWRRDGKSIAAWTAEWRARIAAERTQVLTYRYLPGPQLGRPPLAPLTFMGVEIVWDPWFSV